MTAAVAQSASRALAAFAIVWSVSSPAWAQWEPYPWKNMPRTPDGKIDMNAPTKRTADGKPDLSGFWVPTVAVKHLLNLAADLKPEEVPLKPWAAEVYKERIETNGKNHPGVRCWPSGIPEKNNIPDGLKVVQTPDLTLFLQERRRLAERDTMPDALKVVQTPDLMLFLHESRTIYRQIFTDGRPLPKDAQPTWVGYLIWRLEGETFVLRALGQE